jgi:hypothetical protein
VGAEEHLPLDHPQLQPHDRHGPLLGAGGHGRPRGGRLGPHGPSDLPGDGGGRGCGDAGREWSIGGGVCQLLGEVEVAEVDTRLVLMGLVEGIACVAYG